jgi:hypothetical protein
VQKLHAGLNANSASWPACGFFLQAEMQKIHPGLNANFASWREGKKRTQASGKFLHPGVLRAFFACQVSAKSAPLLSAKIARDS